MVGLEEAILWNQKVCHIVINRLIMLGIIIRKIQSVYNVAEVKSNQIIYTYT